MRQLLLFIFLVSTVSCVQEKKAFEGAYFAGEIVNPTSDYVVLYKNDAVVDSAKLDKNNRFSFSLQSIDEGLHHFDHAPQYQYVYLEKGDSLLIRLNASPSYFDESLVFSGDNDVVNNFMIEMFLTHEDEESLVYSYFQLPPEEFSSKIDSLRSQKLDELALLVNNENISPDGYALAQASVDYTSYIYKEKYPFYHKKKTGENTFHELDSSFYHYRGQLQLNDQRLSYFRPYYDFMKHHLGNLAYMECSKNCEMESFVSAKNQLHLNKHKMAIIDSLVDENHLRDNLLRNVAMDYLLKVHVANEDCYQFIKDFEGLSNNTSHEEEINHLYKGIQGLQPNRNLPHLVLEDANGKTTTLKEISKNNKTVFYFWTADQKRHFRNVMKQVAKLRSMYPEYKFIGINLRTTKGEWETILAERGLNREEQFRGADFETVQNTLIVDHLNKCVIAKDSLIVDAFGNLYVSLNP